MESDRGVEDLELGLDHKLLLKMPDSLEEDDCRPGGDRKENEDDFESLVLPGDEWIESVLILEELDNPKYEDSLSLDRELGLEDGSGN